MSPVKSILSPSPRDQDLLMARVTFLLAESEVFARRAQAGAVATAVSVVR
jgi:hypothetical protein